MTLEDWILVTLTIALVVVHLWHSYYESYMVIKQDPKPWATTLAYNISGFLQTALVIGLAIGCIMRMAVKAA
jgi:hypothetical protein